MKNGIIIDIEIWWEGKNAVRLSLNREECVGEQEVGVVNMVINLSASYSAGNCL